MSQDRNGPSVSAGGQEHIFRKLDDLGAMHMRTREDMAEVRAKVQTIAESQNRFEKRQEHFEDELRREMDSRHTQTQEEINNLKTATNRRMDEIEGKVTTIREERIAEKAQWRGPEKVIAALVAAAGGVAAIATLLNFVHK